MFGTKYELGKPVFILKQRLFSHKWYVKECEVKAFKIHNKIEANNIGPYVSCQIQLGRFENINCLFDTKAKSISKDNHIYKENDLYPNIYFDENKANRECVKRNKIIDNSLTK